MGQYYFPVNLDKKEYLCSHDFKTRYVRKEDKKVYYISEGLKLMEHSYIGNIMMNAVEKLIIPNGNWYKNRLVWAGDYADHEVGHKKTNNGKDVNLFHIMMDMEGTKIKPSTKKVDKKYRYLTNHSKKVIIDLTIIRPTEDGMNLHPLSLLIAEGNGRGGGDFRGEDKRVGSWSRDIISLEEKMIDGYQLVDGQFIEE